MSTITTTTVMNNTDATALTMAQKLQLWREQKKAAKAKENVQHSQPSKNRLSTANATIPIATTTMTSMPTGKGARISKVPTASEIAATAVRKPLSSITNINMNSSAKRRRSSIKSTMGVPIKENTLPFKKVKKSSAFETSYNNKVSQLGSPAIGCATKTACDSTNEVEVNDNSNLLETTRTPSPSQIVQLRHRLSALRTASARKKELTQQSMIISPVSGIDTHQVADSHDSQPNQHSSPQIIRSLLESLSTEGMEGAITAEMENCDRHSSRLSLTLPLFSASDKTEFSVLLTPTSAERNDSFGISSNQSTQKSTYTNTPTDESPALEIIETDGHLELNRLESDVCLFDDNDYIPGLSTPYPSRSTSLILTESVSPPKVSETIAEHEDRLPKDYANLLMHQSAERVIVDSPPSNTAVCPALITCKVETKDEQHAIVAQTSRRRESNKIVRQEATETFVSSVVVLSEVKARPSQVARFGTSTFLSPVRRSTRSMPNNESSHGSIEYGQSTNKLFSSSQGREKLASVGYAYLPNPALETQSPRGYKETERREQAPKLDSIDETSSMETDSSNREYSNQHQVKLEYTDKSETNVCTPMRTPGTAKRGKGHRELATLSPPPIAEPSVIVLQKVRAPSSLNNGQTEFFISPVRRSARHTPKQSFMEMALMIAKEEAPIKPNNSLGDRAAEAFREFPTTAPRPSNIDLNELQNSLPAPAAKFVNQKRICTPILPSNRRSQCLSASSTVATAKGNSTANNATKKKTTNLLPPVPVFL